MSDDDPRQEPFGRGWSNSDGPDSRYRRPNPRHIALMFAALAGVWVLLALWSWVQFDGPDFIHLLNVAVFGFLAAAFYFGPKSRKG